MMTFSLLFLSVFLIKVEGVILPGLANMFKFLQWAHFFDNFRLFLISHLKIILNFVILEKKILTDIYSLVALCGAKYFQACIAEVSNQAG